MTKIESSLCLQNIELTLSLGWSAKERAQKQTLLMDITLTLAEPPKACETDELTDTYCYDTLIKKIQNEMEPREFRLIEHLAATIHHSLKACLPQVKQIHVAIKKNLAEVGLSGQAIFNYTNG